jgi:hypothetical protein
MIATAFTSATAPAFRAAAFRAPAFDIQRAPATAFGLLNTLCTEIRSRTFETVANYHWCVDIPDQVFMQAISCAKCGNYQLVSSRQLHIALMETAPTILCQDPEHIRITDEAIFAETGLEPEEEEENEDQDTDSQPGLEYEVRNERLDDWSQEEGNYDWVSDSYFPEQQ